MQIKGRIIHANGFSFKVISSEKVIYDAKPIGKLKTLKQIPKIGDWVEVEVPQNVNRKELNTITKIFPRENYLSRPIIANINQIIIVASVKEPNFDLFLLLKLITSFQAQHIEMIFCFTKMDLLNAEELIIIEKYITFFTNLNYQVLRLGFKNYLNWQTLFELIPDDNFNVITGQSGSGKSTLLNYLNMNEEIKTNEISKKLNRGKHTTRNYTAYYFKKFYIVDTPGFSSFELEQFTKQDLATYFLDFQSTKSKCRFNDCTHINEPKCFIKETYQKSNDPIKNEVYEIYSKIFQ